MTKAKIQDASITTTVGTRARRGAAGYRTSTKRQTGPRRISVNDPFLIVQDEQRIIDYIKSVLRHSGKLTYFENFYQCHSKGSTTRISASFISQVKAVATAISIDRAMNSGLPRIPTSTIVCELIGVGLSLIDPSSVLGIKPLDPPSTIHRQALIEAVKGIDLLDPIDRHETLQVSYSLILLHHATTCLRFKSGDPRNFQDGSNHLRALIGSALEFLKNPTAEDL